MGWFFGKKPERIQNDDIERRLESSNKLRAVIKRVRAARNLEQLMLDLSTDICDLFDCDRFTLYAISKDKDVIFSKIKIGIESDQEIVLPVNAHSIAGWVAMTGRTVRLRDVYDKDELRSYADELTFYREADLLTGYHTKQMLAAPIFKYKSAELLGVIQLLNNRAENSFTAFAEKGLNALCEALGIAFMKSAKSAAIDVSKYVPLIDNALLSKTEMDLAARSARRQNLDVEDVLIDEFQVPLSAVGQALATTFKIPYECYQPDRKKPVQLISKIDRKFTEINRCIPIEDDGKNMIVLSIDPARTIGLGAVKKMFPYASLFYRVTTLREFRQTVDSFFGVD